MDLKKILPNNGPPVNEVSKYIEKYKNDLIVIKYGGNVFIDRNIFNNFISDISILNKLGLSIIIVHGGGPRIKKELEKSNIQSKFIRGLRVTDKKIIDIVEKEFQVEKELLLALMGIETNFGKYLGKMDIVSSLATLSYDKRRSEFFSKELLILLKLVDNKIIDRKILYGSWAGAFGNFQFMPRTIRNYAIDYNKNKTIELKNIEDSFASAANYLKTIGWKKNQPCFFKIELKDNIPKKYLNSSARNIKNKRKINFLKRYIKDFDNLNIKDNLSTAIIIPDKDIIPGAETLSPAYLIFDNYEKILNWNRSLRFSLAVCTLKERFENEI